MTDTATPARHALRFANYRGDVREYLLGAVLGPNEEREFLTVIEVSYDAQTDTTRAGFAYATKDEVANADTMYRFMGMIFVNNRFGGGVVRVA